MNRKYCERWLKSCLKKKVSITATTIIMFLMTGLVVNTPIFASVLIGNTDGAPITPNGSVVSSWGITIGGGITNAGSHSVHVGDASLEEGERNVIIGTHATAGVNGGSRQFIRQSVAIGGGASANEGARAFGDQSIAIGANTIAEGNSSIAIGNDDVDRTNTITTKYTNLKGEETTGTIGDAYNALTGKSLMDGGQYRDTKSKEAAVAIGVKALAGNISLALGTASSADVVNGVAIGTGATVTRDNAIAIGGGATTEKEGTKEVDVTVNGIHYTWKGGENTIAGDVVSFGKEGYERQLKHVAAGKVSKDSTDAINGSQLHGVLEHITSEPVYFYAADNSSLDKITGTTAEAKNADALAKKIVARSMSNHRLNILGGATGDLSDNNIGVNYENDSTLRVKLAKELKDLKSTEFKNDTGDVATITGNGLTITPNGNAVSNKNVSVTKDGLNNGGNVIANVGGNLDGAKTGTTVPTTNATVPNNVDGIKNNAATVGDVLQAGWNLQERGVAKDFVKPYDTVNFVDGKGTTVVVNTEADRSTSTIKYDVNLGKGLQKDDTTNEITVKADEKSLTVGTDGVKAKTDNKTITTGDNGLKVVTGGIEAGTTPGTVKVKEDDTGKIATVDSVVNAVNNAAFTLKASAGDGTRNGNSTVNANGESIKAGNTIEMIAGKNLDVKHDGNGKITFATVENPSFDTVQVGNSEGPKFSATTEGNISVSDKEGTNPVKITNVKDGKISANSKDAINGSQFHKVANNTIKLAGQNGEEEATETDPQNLNKQGGIKFTVKSSNGDLLEVTAAEDTVTLTPKTAKITTGTDGVPTANTTDGKLVTADDLVTALKKMGWKATAGNDGTGTVEGNAEELIKAGETVTFKAGDNLKIKQDGKNFIYSLNTALSGLTSAEFKDGDNKVKITPTGITITKPAGTTENTVTLNQNGLNNGGNPITNVTSNLEGAKAGTTAPTTKAAAPNDVVGIKNNAATVGDVLQSGWNLQGNGEEKDFVKPYDTVNFANGDGTTATVETTNNKVSTVKYSVNLGDGLKKDDTGNNTISIKPADKSLEVNKDGVKVKTDGTTITTDDNKGLKVVTGAIESVTTGNDSGTVKVKEGDTGKIATVDSVVNAVNSAAFTLKASATTGGTRNGSSSVGENGEDIKAGKTIEMIAGKNLNVTHNENGKIIFATVDTPTFSTVQVGGDQGPKFSKTSDGDIKVSDKDDANPVKITNVKDGAVTDTSTDAINGSQFHKVANNTIKLAGQNGDDATTATQTKEQNLNKQGGIKFTVKSSDGKLLEVKAADDTITLTPKTATITIGTDGVPTANTNGGKLVTADDLVTALKNMGWKAIAGQEGSGTVAGNAEQLIKAGETVTFKAGNNLAVKQAGKEFIYSLQKELTGLTSAEFKDGDNKVKITPTGITITKPAGTTENTVTLNQNGLNNGGNPITNVTSNLVNYSDPDVNGKAPVRNELRKFDNNAVPNTNVATVGDLRNMGWVVSSNKTTGDLGNPYSETVKNADEVKFVGTGLATVSGKTENGVRTITVDVESKTAINAVTYTKTDGTKVYPVEGPTGTTYHTTPEGNGPNDETVDGSNVITSVNGPKGTKAPSTLSNVAGNLDGAKAGTDAPTTKHDAPNTTEAGQPNYVNTHNAATVGDVLQAGWNLQNNSVEKDFVKPYDTVNFADGNGTTAVVDTTDNKVSTVKYNVNTGNGLEKTTDNKITVKPADKSLDVTEAGVAVKKADQSLEVTDDGLKVKVDGTTIKTGDTGLTVNTGTINKVTEGNTAGTVVAKTGDEHKIATVGNVVNAINNAAWTATSAATAAGELGATETNQLVKAGDKVTFEADKNIKITQNGSKFTFATKDNVTFETVQVGGDQGPKFSKSAAGDIKVSGSDNTTPVKITNVKDGEISETSTDAINGSQFHGLAKNTIKLAGKTGDLDATETAAQDLDKKGGIKFTVKSSDGSLLEVTAEGDTITITPKTGTITTGANGIPTANTDGGKLVTANQLVTALTEMGWKATAGTEGTGIMIGAGATEELIKAGNTVTFKAGDNLSIKQDGKNFIYSLNPALTGLTSAEFKEGDNKVKITPTGITITKPADPTAGTTENTVTLNQNGLNNGGNPITNVTSNLVNYSDPDVNGKAPVRNELRNFNNDAVPDTNVATVGDLRNMGWIVSADKITDDLTTNAYTDTVKNANEVKFVGKGTATVSGKTEGNVRTITVEVNDQVSTNNSVTPVVYTKADGTKVYPKEITKEDRTKEVKFYTNPDGTGTEVPATDVITSVNGPKGTKTPTTLSNVEGNLDGAKTNTQAPTTNHAGVNTTISTAANYVNLHNAATVGDVLNAGWNLQNNGTEKDFVKPYDTVNFINGLGTTAVVTTREGNTASDVTFNVKPANGSVTVDEDGVKVTTGEMKPAVDANNKETGAIATPADPETAKRLKDTLDAAVKELATAKDALKTAEKALAANPTDPALQQAVKDKKAEVTAKQTPVDEAQKAHDDAGLNKIATVQNVAEAINNSGFNLKTSADGGEKLNGSKDDGELIKPSNTVEMVAGNNLTVKQDENGKITYATKDNVTFKNVDTGTLNVGSPNTYTDGKGNTYTKVGENYYNPADVVNGAPKQDATPVTIPADVVMKPVSSVTMKTEAAKPATNNEKSNQPSSALNITSKDGKPTQITGVGSTLNTNVVKTNPEGTATKPGAAPGTTPKTEDVHLVDLNGTKDAPVNKNAAATVGDLQNMGWVVSAKDGNGYKDVVKNANVVDFKGGTGIKITGNTLSDGTREITIGIKEGTVTNQATVKKADKSEVDVVVMDGKYYERDKDTGKPKYDTAGNKIEVTLGTGDKVESKGSGFVTGNTVATAIGESGWNVGKAAKDIIAIGDYKSVSTEITDEKVNPNDNVKFVDGDNTTVSMATKLKTNADGTKVTTTYIKTDINRDIHIDSVTAGGKNADGTPGKDGALTVQDKSGKDGVSIKAKDGEGSIGINGKDANTELKPNGITITPNKADGTPDKAVSLTDKGLNNGGNNITNVAGNLDGAKTGTTAPTTNAAAPTNVDAIKNNAATVGDVLNAGWNLQNNGTAKDFVKPYDTVNFVDGINTKVTVTTDPDGTKSDVRVDVVGLPIAFADKNGNRLVQGKDPVGNPVYYRMLPDGTVDKTLIIPASDVTVTNVNPVDSKVNTVGTRGGATISGIANGAKTFEAPKDKDGKDLKLGNDGKWYPADSVLINNKYYPAGSVVSKNGNVYPAGTTLDKDGNPTTPGTTPVTEVKSVVKPKNPGKAGLINFGHSNSDTTNAATVGDLQNMGWVVSTSDTGYNDQVRNANVVDFKEGEGIKISGETLENGVRQIKVGIDKNVVATKQELAQVERLSSAGIAGVAAMANIPQINEAASNRYNIAVGVGYHKGEKALAVGISGVSDGGRVVYKASAALDSQKQTTVGLGVGYQFGKRDIEPNELDRFRAQLDLVNTQKSSLAQRLKEETHKVVELNNKVEELEKQNKMLNEKMDLILKKLGGK